MNREQLKKLEKDLWAAADKLRANSDLKASEYSTPVLGIIFLKFADNKYRQHEDAIYEEYTRLKGTRMERSLQDIAIEKCGFALAAQCVRTHGTASVGLITLDTYRVSGYEQLRAYGRMLGVVAHLAHDRAALKDLLALLANKRMVIIDTAGLGQRDQRIQDMLDMLEMPQVKKTLVLNASSHGDTIDEVLTAFKASTLHGVVLSKVDEAVKLGPALDALIRHQVVLRGVANGQRVPEDWQNPDAASLVRVSMGTRGKSSYDPVQADMGLYFGQSSARGIDLGGAHV